jgi:16S rRNA (guanine527-N7)-methyltransferase
MVNWCYHLPNENGKFYALKGVYDEQEVAEIQQPITLLDVIELKVPELVGERHLVLLKI